MKNKIGSFHAFFAVFAASAIVFSCLQSDLNAEQISVFEIDDGFVSRGPIDDAVLEDLRTKNILPARLCSDAVFLRRAYISVLGRIPTEAETRSFLQNPAPTNEKRAKIIDELLERPEFADLWTMHWADFLRVKSEFPINLWPHATAVYFRWIHDSVRENKPYDEFARELLMGQGSCFRAPASNFYRAVERKDAVELASAAVLTFLGERTDLWTPEKREQVTVFFSRTAFKGSAQWKEEIVYWDDTPLESSEVVFPDGTKGTVPPGTDPRAVFTQWLVRPENHAFNRALVNRLWFWLTGVGIVDPPDDIRDQNPPVNPKLLEVLEQKLVESHYNVKEVLRMILNSRTYQQASVVRLEEETAAAPATSETPAAAAVLDAQKVELAEKNLAVFPVRRLDAEILQDLFIDLFGAKFPYTSEVPEPFSYVPATLRTVQLYDSGLTNPFLEMFGRSTRDSGLTTDRNNSVNEAQQMFLMNSNEINEWIKSPQQRIKMLQSQKSKDKNEYQKKVFELCSTVWIRYLSRNPTEDEKQRFWELLNSRNADDVIWCIINTREFLCQH